MPKRHKLEPTKLPKPQIRTCMGMVDEDSIFVSKSPLRRADGAAAYNGHFWPLAGDDFWAKQDLGHRYSSRWHVHVIALADGTWLSEGSLYRAVQQPTREAALRVAVARIICTMRNARRWKGSFDYLNADDFRAVVTWALGLVGRPAPRIRVATPPDLPQALPAWSDLPLFAATAVASVQP